MATIHPDRDKKNRTWLRVLRGPVEPPKPPKSREVPSTKDAKPG